MKLIDGNSTPEEITEASKTIIRFAENVSANPGIAATLITHAVALYAANQEAGPAALAHQVSFLTAQLAKWLDVENELASAVNENSATTSDAPKAGA